MSRYREIDTTNFPMIKKEFVVADKTMNEFVFETLNWSANYGDNVAFGTTKHIEKATKHYSYLSAILHMNCYNKNLNHNCSIIKINTQYSEVI